MKTVYKVVKLDATKRKFSLWATLLAIEYVPNKIARPEIGKIFAFKTPEEAMVFMRMMAHVHFQNKYEVWEAITSKNYLPKWKYFTSCDSFISDQNFVTKFWNTNRKFRALKSAQVKSIELEEIPAGTVLCNDIMLIRRISK